MEEPRAVGMLWLQEVASLACRPIGWTLFCRKWRVLCTGPAQVDVPSRKICVHPLKKSETQKGPWPGTCFLV